MKKPKKWTEVYPQGTEEGNEEQAFFIALARHPQWASRSTSTIVEETGLSRKRVEEILDKYLKLGIIFPHSTNEDHWVYWERDLELLIKPKSLSRTDQDKRIKRYLADHLEEDLDI